MSFASSSPNFRNVADKAILDGVESAGLRMRIDPAHVNQTAAKFEDLAEEVAERAGAVERLGEIVPPSPDPVSTQAVKVYGEVARGGAGEYHATLIKLSESLRNTAVKLRSTAGQVRYTEETNTGLTSQG